MGAVARDDALRKRYRAYAKRHQLPCAICLLPIDYTLKHPDPESLTADHAIPINKGGADAWDNLQAAHRTCNRDKWDRLPDDMQEPGPRQFVTSRTW